MTGMGMKHLTKLGVTTVLSTILLSFIALPSLAQTDSETLQKLIQRVDQLEKSLAETKAQLAEAQKTVAELPAAQAEKVAAPPVTVKTGGGEVLTIKGFIDGTFFSQDQSFEFGNGQNAQWPSPPQSAHNRWFSGGDMRNTRLTLDFDGPKLANGWKVHSVIEGDFFGGYNGTGAFSNEQETPRLRLAYVDMQKGGTTIRLGQDWSPLFGNVPVSMSHIAFPLGYGSAGDIGWRFPGLYIYQDLTGKNASTKVQFVGGIFQGSWNGPGNNLGWQSAGSVGFRPQIEARFNFSGKFSPNAAWSAYIVGHYDSKNLAGVNGLNPGPGPKHDTLSGKAYEAGYKFDVAKFMLQGNVYYGRAIGQQFGNLTQFGDISGWGGWMQVGYNFTDRFSAFAFYGVDNPNDNDVRQWVSAGGRLKNWQSDVMFRYKIGPYALGLEWLHAQLDSYSAITSPVMTTDGNQIALSVMYSF